MKTSLPVFFLTVLAAIAPLQAQVIVGHDITKSGRLQTGIGLDTTFGVTSFTSGNFTANTGTLGDSNNNNKQQTIFAFQVDSAWLTAYSNVDTVEFSFRVGSINAGGGTPASIQISLLAINNGTADPWDVASNAPLASLGTVSGTAIGDHAIDIKSVLTAAATQPSATNNTIWFGLSGGFSDNNAANNVLLNMTNASFQLPELSVTPIPEPSSYALLAGGLGVIAFLRRRRRLR